MLTGMTELEARLLLAEMTHYTPFIQAGISLVSEASELGTWVIRALTPDGQGERLYRSSGQWLQDKAFFGDVENATDRSGKPSTGYQSGLPVLSRDPVPDRSVRV